MTGRFSGDPPDVSVVNNTEVCKRACVESCKRACMGTTANSLRRPGGSRGILPTFLRRAVQNSPRPRGEQPRARRHKTGSALWPGNESEASKVAERISRGPPDAPMANNTDWTGKRAHDGDRAGVG